MPNDGASGLRIYCLCGQKMKVSGAMYGKPARCVACGQKIRIPRRQEVPQNTASLRLEDHPELLRKPSSRRPDKKGGPPAKSEEDNAEKSGSVPLDALSPLQVLCSLEMKTRRQQEFIEAAEKREEADTRDLARLDAHLARIAEARKSLDEDLHQRLMEVAIELTSTRQKIGDMGLAARVGDMDFAEYHEHVGRLRRRRDCLEQRQANLRSWLATRDPYAAGGYVDVPMERLTDTPLRAVFRGEPDETKPPAESYVEALRDRLAFAQEAERKLAELDRMGETEEVSVAKLRDMRAEFHGAKRRAAAGAEFWRGRLEQVKTDLSNDLEITDAQLNILRGQLKLGELEPSSFDEAERALRQAQSDITRARSVVARALSANSAQDVPRPHGTFLDRLAPAAGDGAQPVDRWLLWGSTILLVITLFLPLAGSSSPFALALELYGETAAVAWLLAGPLLGAIVVALLAALARASLRAALAALWASAMGLGAAFFLHESLYAPGALAEALGSSAFWLFRPAGIVYLLAVAVILSAACLATLREKSSARIIIGLSTALLVMGSILIWTDCAGLFKAHLPEAAYAVSDAEGGTYPATVTVENTSRRKLHFSSSDARAAFSVYVQRRKGQNSWAEVPPLEPGGGVLPPGAEMASSYALAPGEYRILVRMAWANEEHTQPFTLESIPEPAEVDDSAEKPEASPAEASETEENVAGSEDTGSPASSRLTEGVDVELRGIASATEREPRFSLIVYFPDGKSKKRMLEIGGTVFGEWKIREYSPDNQTVTLHDGKEILVLRRGKRERLEDL